MHVSNGSDGANCSIDIDECESDPCKNNATCNNEFGYYYCECTLGHTGVRCGTEINYCVDGGNPCVMGECNTFVGYYTCDCDPGITGHNCDIGENAP